MVHNDERCAVIGPKITDTDVLPIATEVRKCQGLAIEHAQEAWRTTAVLDIGPSIFGDGSHVKAIACRDEFGF
jgi:hypothetical protein